MTIHVSNDVEHAIDAAVRSGQFASADEMVDKVIRDYARKHPVPPPTHLPQPEDAETTPDPFLGLWKDDAEELDAIVEDAMRRRQISGWLPCKEDFDTLEWACGESGRSLYELLDDALRTWIQPWRLRQEQSKRIAGNNSDNAACKPIWERAQELAAAIPDEVEEWPHKPEGIDLGTADANDPQTRRKLIEELGRRMNHLSEAAYCAGWMHGLEEEVPALCEQAVKTGKLQPFGGTVICPGLAARLLAMRQKLGHWVVSSAEGGYEPCPPPARAEDRG